ncbi:MAG: endopeptidase La [Deltaproteobacteria bacterium]|nr:endopeptidase La [Deltaproteobacteria bacterium]
MIFKSHKEHAVTYMMMPLRDIVVFPHMVSPLFVGRERSIAAVEKALEQGKTIFLVTQKDASIDSPSQETVYPVGVLATILQMLKLPDGSIKVLVEGKKRGRINKFLVEDDSFSALVEEVDDTCRDANEVKALNAMILDSLDNFAKFTKRIPPDMVATAAAVDDPSRLADLIAPQLNVSLSDKQQILELTDVCERLERVYAIMESAMELIRTEQRIKTRVKRQMEKTQKDYYLNEQMRAIQKEIGDTDDRQAEIDELEEKLQSKKHLSEEARTRVDKEIKKLKMMPPMSAEMNVVRNYIEWILSLPWGEKSDVKMDIGPAEQILNDDHYGLKEPKERILEYLAVESLVQKLKGPILCFVGPPGVGKTSLGKSIARATGRRFVRLSLGGVRDEAEIRGHRRTYIGALPGKILQSLKKAGTDNPVFLLDEVDKMSTDFRGDPSSALLEVLDPEQNDTFNDHYIDMDYDLSGVMFITTANTLQGIPPALQDRMEIIRIAGYMESEKLAIAKQYLVPKQLEANGLAAGQLEFSDNSVLHIIRRYTREAGVRNLEREIASICRKVATDLVRQGAQEGGERKVKIDKSSVEKYLGVPRFRYGTAEEKNKVGISTGLAWTEVGGELLFIEVAVMSGKGELIITGKLGDVMKESARAAMSYVRSRAQLLGLDKEFYQLIDLHIHVPEGAIPKDGPSAGIAITTAIISALTRVEVKKDIAMTGEITLRGRVLPIGGLKEKIFAAHRGLISTVIIPRENEKDLKDIPEKILKDLKIVMVDHMDEVIRLALVTDSAEAFAGKAVEDKQFFREPPAPEDIPPQLHQ